MIKLRGNWLLWQIIIVYAIFILAGLFIVPRPYMSGGAAIMAVATGWAMAFRYSGMAFDVILRSTRGKYGAHNAVLGAAELAWGLVASGMYRLAWLYEGQPMSWSGSVWGAIGLFMIAKGCFRLAISPDEVTPGNRFPEGFWMLALWVGGIVVAFVAGTNFSSFGQ